MKLTLNATSLLESNAHNLGLSSMSESSICFKRSEWLSLTTVLIANAIYSKALSFPTLEYP
jgi:hypothetical protein